MKDDLLNWRQRAALWGRLGIRLVILLSVLLLWGRFGRRVLELTMPFLLGWCMAILLDPVVKWVQKRTRASRRTVSLVVVLGLLGLVIGGVFLLAYYAGHEMMSLLRNWEVLFDGIQSALDSIELMFARMFAIVPPELSATVDAAIEEVLQWLEATIPQALKGIGEGAKDKFMGVPSFLIATIMFVMGTYFITADYPAICRSAAKNMGSGASRFLNQVRTTALVAFGGYLKAQLLLSAGVFCILLLGFLLTGQEYALLLALGLAVLDFIPLLGAGTAMVPWAIVALLSKNYQSAVAVMLIWGVIAVYRRVAEPKIVGDQTGLSPILSLFSIYIGMKLAGVLGMILGPILVLVVLNLARSGMFEGILSDLRTAARDVSAFLAQRPGT